MYLIKRIIVFVFIVITANAGYSQKKKLNCYFSFSKMDSLLYPISRDTTFYIYMDSNIVNGLIVYTDSIRVDALIKVDIFTTEGIHSIGYDGGCIVAESGVALYKIDYPITLIDNPLFKKAIYRDDDCMTGRLSHRVADISYYQQKFGTAESKKKVYFILSFDGKYIKYGFLEEKDGDLYTKYDPLNENNGGTVTTIKRKKLRDWLTQEMSKTEVTSITKIRNVYIAKSFSN